MKKRLFTIFVILVIVGIIVEKYLSINLSTIFVLWAILIFLTILLYFFSKNDFVKFFRDSIIYLNIIFIGLTLYRLDYSNTPNYPFGKQKINNVQIYGKVSGINLIQKDKIIFTLYSDSVFINSHQYEFKAKFLTKIYEKNSRKLNYLYNKISDGNIVRLKGVITKPPGVRNPGEFNYYHYLVEKGYSAIFNVFGIRNIRIVSNRKDFIGNEIFQIRKTINSKINQLYTHKSAALLRGLLLADRSQIDYNLKEQFVNTGVVHVLAVSGLHVGYIVLIFIFLFSRFNIILRYILTIIGLLFFLVITNSPPSVFRAVLMAIIMIISLLSNRNYDSINTISLAALILLIINPSNLFNPGFQLSFSAVIAIIIFVPFFKIKIDESKLRNGTIKKLLLFLSVTISAMVGTLPFTLAYFHKLSIAAIFANLVVIPLIGAILAVGIFSLIISVISIWIALIYAAANKLLIAILYFIVSNLGSLKVSYIDIHQFSLYDSILFYILIITTILFWKKFTHLKAKIILTFLLAAIFFIYSNLDKKELLPNGKLSVVAIDIGQGDSFLLKFPKGTTVLIDAGNATDNFSSGQRIIIPLLKYLEIGRASCRERV